MHSSQNLIEKPIQLISINSFGKLVLHAQGVCFLRSLCPPISVLSIAGPYRTGKSFLLNCMINSNNAFNVGHTTNATTNGLWIWSKPILAYNDEGKITSVIVMDSEGFANAEGTHDKRIITLALLLSTSFMYNSNGPIDKQSLFDLEFIIDVARAMSSTSQKISSCDFHWILRDFHLNLINEMGIPITSKLYMENSLLLAQQKVSQHTVDTFKNYFPNRNCHCLIQPLQYRQSQSKQYKQSQSKQYKQSQSKQYKQSQSKQYKQSQSKQYKQSQSKQYNSSSNKAIQIRPQFIQQVIQLRKILTGIKSCNYDGMSFIIILQSYVDAINNGDSLNKVFQEGYDCHVRLDCLQKLHDELKQFDQSRSVQEIENVDERLYDIRSELKEYYKQRMCSHKQITVLDQELDQIIQEYQQQDIQYSVKVLQPNTYTTCKEVQRQATKEQFNLKDQLSFKDLLSFKEANNQNQNSSQENNQKYPNNVIKYQRRNSPWRNQKMVRVSLKVQESQSLDEERKQQTNQNKQQRVIKVKIHGASSEEEEKPNKINPYANQRTSIFKNHQQYSEQLKSESSDEIDEETNNKGDKQYLGVSKNNHGNFINNNNPNNNNHNNNNPNNNYQCSINRMQGSINQIGSYKNNRSFKTFSNLKIEEYETKVYRYELEANCSKKEITNLKEQYEKIKQENERKGVWIQELILNSESIQKNLHETVCKLEENIEQLKQEKVLALSQIEKIQMLHQEKIQFLQHELEESAEEAKKQLERKDHKYKAKINQCIVEIQDLKINHQKEINQVKEIYASSRGFQRMGTMFSETGKSINIRGGNEDQGFYKDFKEQSHLIQNLKEELQKYKYSKNQQENMIKTMKNKIQQTEERYKELIQQQNKRNKENEMHIQNIWMNKLENKSKLINELEERIEMLMKDIEEIQMKYIKEIQSREQEYSSRGRDVEKLEGFIGEINQELVKLRHENAKIKQSLEEKEESYQKYVLDIASLEIKVEELQRENNTYKQSLQENKKMLEEEIQENHQLIEQFKKQLENQQNQKQKIQENKEEGILELKKIYEMQKCKFEQKIENLHENLNYYKNLEVDYEVLRKQFDIKMEEFQELEDQFQQKMEENKKNNQQLRQEIGQLKQEKSNHIQSLNKIEMDFNQKYLEMSNDFKENQQYLSKKHEQMLKNIIKRQKQIFDLQQKLTSTEKNKKQLEKQNYEQLKQFKEQSMSKQINYKKQMQKMHNEIQILNHNEKNKSNEIALLQQKYSFFNENLKQIEQKKDIEIERQSKRYSKNEEKYQKMLTDKEKTIAILTKENGIYQKDQQMAIININQLQKRYQEEQVLHANHVELFNKTIIEIKQKNKHLTATTSKLSSENQQLGKQKELISKNYQKDYELWTSKLLVYQNKVRILQEKDNKNRKSNEFSSRGFVGIDMKNVNL